MPHAVFRPGSLSATTEAQHRALVPGIEPGGSRAGQAMKPALLIRDAWLELIAYAPSTGTVQTNMMTYFLKLSQETDMTPGLVLPVGQIGHTVIEGDTGGGTSATATPVTVQDMFHAQGTIWAPRFVGVRAVEVGGMTLNVNVHLDYERVDVPWMDWFVMWDFLDNITDNELEY